MHETLGRDCAFPITRADTLGRRSAAAALTLALVAALSLYWPSCEAAAQLYRWVDDQGNIHYTDKIPPSQAERGHTELSDDGVRVRTIPPAKTPEEIQRERELERLRAEQQRLIEQQQAADRVLLNTFRSADDLIMVRDGLVSAIDVQIQVTKGSTRRQQEWLAKLRSQAADLERAGEPVSEQLEEGIARAQRSMSQSMATIVEREQQKQEIHASFARDLKRFLQLNDLPESGAEDQALRPKPLLENLVECNDPTECDRLWLRARAYLEQHATLPIETTGADIVITAAPTAETDIGLTVSRLWNEDQRGALIFLDLQCISYSANPKRCRTDDRLKILDGFRTALHGSAAQAAR
jgi:hypothetical protein